MEIWPECSENLRSRDGIRPGRKSVVEAFPLSLRLSNARCILAISASIWCISGRQNHSFNPQDWSIHLRYGSHKLNSLYEDTKGCYGVWFVLAIFVYKDLARAHTRDLEYAAQKLIAHFHFKGIYKCSNNINQCQQWKWYREALTCR